MQSPLKCIDVDEKSSHRLPLVGRLVFLRKIQVVDKFEIPINRQVFTVPLITGDNFIFNLLLRKKILKINIL